MNPKIGGMVLPKKKKLRYGVDTGQAVFTKTLKSLSTLKN